MKIHYDKCHRTADPGSEVYVPRWQCGLVWPLVWAPEPGGTVEEQQQ